MPEQIQYVIDNPRHISFTLSREVKPHHMQDAVYLHRPDPDTVWASDIPDFHRAHSSLRMAMDERNLLARLSGIWDIEGVVSVSTRRHELGVQLGTAHEVDATRLEAMKTVLLERFFRGASAVEFTGKNAHA